MKKKTAILLGALTLPLALIMGCAPTAAPTSEKHTDTEATSNAESTAMTENETEAPASMSPEKIADYYPDMADIDLDALGYKVDTDAVFEDSRRNGSKFLYLTSEKYHYSFGYYSNNSWVTSELIIMMRSTEAKNFKDCDLVAVDTAKRKVWELGVTTNDYTGMAVFHELVYYIDGSSLFTLNLKTGDIEKVVSHPGMNFPHFTNDGRYVNWETTINGKSACIVYDIEAGTKSVAFEMRFDDPYPIANHMMICPTDPTRVFFAHEGTTQYIPDRLWLAEEGKEPRCIAVQNYTESGELGDCFGHECWSFDGVGLWFVKYSCSPTSPKGICYVNLETGVQEIIYSKYPYWHVSCSPDGRYVAADTQSGAYSGVCLVDRTTGREKMLVRANTNWVHPCHPHPSFSPASDMLAFHDLSSSGNVSVGFITIADVKM